MKAPRPETAARVFRQFANNLAGTLAREGTRPPQSAPAVRGGRRG